MLRGYVDEVFVSIQGEGPLVGTPMLFVRLGGCAAACEHCDTPRARTQLSQFTVHGAIPEVLPNPIKVAALTARTLPLLKPLPFLALTGGEPLEQPGFLSLLLTRLSEAGSRVLLETNGNYPRELAEVLPRTDVVAVDIKLPSFSGRPLNVDLTRQFLSVAASKSCYVKVVVGTDTGDEEIMTAARLVATVDANIPFILQPRWDGGPPPLEYTGRLLDQAVRIFPLLNDVRVVPQLQRVLGVR